MDGAVPLDVRARTIFDYFKKYNYEVGGIPSGILMSRLPCTGLAAAAMHQ